MEGFIIFTRRMHACIFTWLFAMLLFIPQISTAQTVTENTQMAFGGASAPGTGSVTVILGLNDSITGGTADLAGAGTVTTGDYKIGKGGINGNVLIDIDVTDTTTTTGLSLTSFTGTYDGNPITFPATNQPNPGVSGKILRVGATLNITSAVTPGVGINPTFDITVTAVP